MDSRVASTTNAAASAPAEGSTATYDAAPQQLLNPPDFRSAPAYIIFQDLIFILSQIRYLPGVFLPLNLDRGGVFEDLTPAGLVYQIVAVLITLAIVPVAVVSLVTGVPSPLVVILGISAVIGLLFGLQGEQTIVPIQPDPEGKFKNETWLFINGIATTTSGHKKALARIKELFGRDCIGINNKSLGFIGDLLECLVQRDLHWRTTDIRNGYQVLRRVVNDESKSRIVILAHSQGALELSELVDQLLAEFPARKLKRIEMYTIASAANHFSAPLNLDNSPPFANVEHFAHTHDFVARIGVLAFTSPQQAELPISGKMDATTGAGPVVDSESGSAPVVVESQFAGRLFVKEASGHLLCSHYFGKDNILDSPAAQKYSRLNKYRNGGLPA